MTFKSVRMSGLGPARLRRSGCTGTYRKEAAVKLLFMGKPGEAAISHDRGTVPQTSGSYFSQPSPCRSQGRQTEKSIPPTLDSSLQGSPSAPLSVTVSPSSGRGTADKVGVRAY